MYFVQVKGAWRYSDTKIVEVEFRSPGPDGQPTGFPVKNYDYGPYAGSAQFDDCKWLSASATFDPTGSATAYVSENYACNLPTPDPTVVARLLDT